MRAKWGPFLGNPSDIDFMGAGRRKTLQKNGGAWLYAMVIGERGREVILIEAQFATVPLKSFQGTLEKYSCWPTPNSGSKVYKSIRFRTW